MLLVGCGESQSPHKAVFSDEAPAAIGPYSQAVQVGDVVYLAGQIGIDPPSGVLVEGGIEAQTKQTLDNLGAVLKEAGMDYDNVVRATVFLLRPRPYGPPLRGRTALRNGIRNRWPQGHHNTEQGHGRFHLKKADPWSKNGGRRTRRVAVSLEMEWGLKRHIEVYAGCLSRVGLG